MAAKSLDLELDSVQYAKTGTSPSGLGITGDLTVEFWFKREVEDVAFSLVTKYDTVSNGKAWRLQCYDDNATIAMSISDDGSGQDTHSVAGDAQSTGTWYHIAVTFDASAHEIEYFLDSVSQGTDDTGGTHTSIYNTATPVLVGCHYLSGSPALSADGLIDEVRIWSDIRTQQEIADNFEKELVGNEAGLAGYWKFNDDYTDETTNANTLTPVSSPVFSSDIPFAVQTDYELVMAVGAFTLTGVAATLKSARKLALAVGEFTLTGIATTFNRGWNAILSAGAFTLTGIDALFDRGKRLVCVVGAFTLTGIDAVITSARTLALAVGTFTLTGVSALFVYGKTLVASAGSFTLTGINALFQYGRTLAMAVGEFTLTGVSALFAKAISLVMSVGTFILTGISAAFTFDGWTADTKPSSSWTEDTLPSDSWTNDT